MARMNRLTKLIKAAQSNDVANTFVRDLETVIEKESIRKGLPTPSYKPSGIGGCMRLMYYHITQEQPDGGGMDANLAGMCESGTDRHERIQNYVMMMKKHNIECEWVDVGEYLKEHPVEGTTVIENKGNETKCFNSVYNLRFLCDGIIKYRGEYFILEIKTESTFKHNHDDAFEKHKKQATCYSASLGIDKVIFLYENRDSCGKKAFLVEITELMKKNLHDTIRSCDLCVETKTVPPRCEDRNECIYCDYKNACRRDGK